MGGQAAVPARIGIPVGIVVELSVEPGLPPVHGVVGELNHVWLNLIDNAVDAAPQSGPVSVLARVDRGDGMIEVVDDEPGIASEHLGRVFDQGCRGDDERDYARRTSCGPHTRVGYGVADLRTNARCTPSGSARFPPPSNSG